MCGIFGCLGNGDTITETLKGLQILEYRGYDSAGITYQKRTGTLETIKAVGDIAKLKAKIPHPPKTNLCLGHTRWATNGGVCEENAHPQLSQNKAIAVVHNGIIENYSDCVTKLKAEGIKLSSNVDTEVIPNILYILHHDKHDIHKILQGHYAFASISSITPNTIMLGKKGNLPLYIGKAPDQVFITSDTLALPNKVKEIIALEDGDTAEIQPNKITFFNNSIPTRKDWQPFRQTFIASNKNSYRTYMEKEINEIPDVIQNILDSYQKQPHYQQQLKTWNFALKHADHIHLCGCGTSYHVALILATLCEKYLKITARAHISSEFTADNLLPGQNIAIVLSQSGETADTLIAMQILKAHQVPIIALCNVTTSSIAKQSQVTFPLLCGPEIAVASTKAFIAPLVIGCLLLESFKNTDFNALPNLARTQLKNTIPVTAPAPSKTFFIGKQLDYFLALESALKVKEVTYTHCEGYPANELKHGPLSLVEEHTLAIVFQSQTDNAISEISARGGRVIVLPDPSPQNPLSFIVKIIPAQLFALRYAESLGINPDRPRNLAKSVTVL